MVFYCPPLKFVAIIIRSNAPWISFRPRWQLILLCFDVCTWLSCPSNKCYNYEDPFSLTTQNRFATSQWFLKLLSNLALAGAQITPWCDRRSNNTDIRLGLFVLVLIRMASPRQLWTYITDCPEIVYKLFDGKLRIINWLVINQLLIDWKQVYRSSRANRSRWRSWLDTGPLFC